MGIFSFLQKKRVTDWSTAGQNYAFYFGQSDAGRNVNERSAMQLSAVYACVRVLSETLACLPLDVFEYTDDRGSRKAIDHPLYKILHDEPNSEMTSFQFRETLMTHLLLWGNAYAQIIRNGKGEVIGLYPLMPAKMQVHRDPETRKIYYRYQTANNERKPDEIGTVILQPEDVLHIPGLGYDGLVGYSPIAMAKNAVGMALAAEEYGSKFFANSAAPAGVLEHPGTLKDPQKLRDSWNAAYGGARNSNKVAVLEEGMKFQPISISNEQAQFLETRKFQVGEIARIFRIPPHMIGDLDRATFSNIEHQSLEFVKYTVDPWVERWEQSMGRRLLREDEKKKYYIQFNVDALLRGDLSSRYNAYATARQNGWMSANDIRAREGLNLISEEQGGDRYLVNGSMIDISTAGKPKTVEEVEEQVMSETVQEQPPKTKKIKKDSTK